MPKITRRRMVAILAVLIILVVWGMIRRPFPGDDDPVSAKMTRMRAALTTSEGLHRIWNDTQEPFLERLGWTRRKQFVVSVSFLTKVVLINRDDADTRHPGLLTSHRDGKTEITRIEPAIAVALQAGQAAHPQLRTDEETIRWNGSINILRAGKYRFSAKLRGKFRLEIAGKEVFAGDVKEAAALRRGDEVQLPDGMQPLVATFTRYPGSARLELQWRGPHFQSEPLADDHFFHEMEQENAKVKRAEQIERGRSLAEEHACTRCHQTADTDRLARALTVRQAPDLSRIGERVYPGWLFAWLESPQKLQPGAVMPRLFSDDDNGRVERYTVARYLTTLGGPLK
ncbi:MAG TPA: hypothetical protein VGY58_22585, partial [Gemmataceae bacterium]|nr:hypothetical protein [Gemmataceae bacterium]